jgi:hypothetical protein
MRRNGGFADGKKYIYIDIKQEALARGKGWALLGEHV